MRRRHPTQDRPGTIKAPLRKVIVRGPSMLPTFSEGERLLVSGWAPWRERSLVALVDPTDPGRILVKRVEAVGPDGVRVRGDNAGASTDSRDWGPVPAAAVLGRVVYRYGPTAVAGRIPDGYGAG